MPLGKHVALRPATPEDAQLLAGWYNDPGFVGPYFNFHLTTAQSWAQRLAGPPDASGLERYLITRPDLGEPMGLIVVGNPFTVTWLYQGKELGYLVHPHHRGRGVATQAACLLINHLFDAAPTERIQALVVLGNDASCRVLERAGMQRDGLYRKVMFLHGRYVDMHHYAIVREDWRDEDAYRQGRDF
jgi:RimJ/RimL family protein N-acetyltransferase